MTSAQLDRFGVIGAAEDRDLQMIARLAAQICGVPTAAVNLLDEVEQHSIAAFGHERGVVPLAESFCAHTIGADLPVYVQDARADERFDRHPHVTGELGCIRFYAGSQLRTADGFTVGTLCVFDEAEHVLDAGQRAALDDLAAQAMQILELRAEALRLTASNDELSRSNADLATFARRIAHDLRNPITATSGFLQLAQNRFGEGLTGPARECVEHAAGACQRMAELVDDLLAYAAVGAHPRRELVDVAVVLAGVRTDVQGLIDSSGGTLEVGPLPWVETDPTLLRQLVQNFITNALKYNRPGTAPRVIVSGSEQGGCWWLSVADNGRGIPVAERGPAFDPFVRLPGGRDVAGSGIGLATCARIADAIGAHIAITDTAGGGCTFTVKVEAPG